MTFITARDLRLKAADVWELLKREGDIVVTVNGRPVAILTGTTPEAIEESLMMLKRLRAQIAVAKMRSVSGKKPGMTADSIEREIRAVRKKRK